MSAGIDIASDKKQQNLVVSLNRQSTFDYFNSISSSNDTKTFWRQCKTYFSNKHAVGNSKIMLIENYKMILDNESVSDKFNNYFPQIVDSLDLYEFPSEPPREYANENDNSKVVVWQLLSTKNNEKKPSQVCSSKRSL